MRGNTPLGASAPREACAATDERDTRQLWQHTIALVSREPEKHEKHEQQHEDSKRYRVHNHHDRKQERYTAFRE